MVRSRLFWKVASGIDGQQAVAGTRVWNLDAICETKAVAELLALDVPVILAGDYNVMPTGLDAYKPERWRDDALFRPETKEAFHTLTGQGWTDALRRLHPRERIYTFWNQFRNAWRRDAELRIDHFLLAPAVAGRLQSAGVDCHVHGWEK